MNIAPIQNNNSQSFGMAFKLEGNGARKLATFMEEANESTVKHLTDDLLEPIHKLGTKVIFDGENVLIHGKIVSNKIPEVMPYTNAKALQYIYGDKGYYVKYAEPQERLIDARECHPLLQALHNAREIAKDMDAKLAAQAYEKAQAAAKQARIDEKAKNLMEKFG